MIKDWLAEYNPKNKDEAQSGLREIMQEVALAGLYHGGFFEKRHLPSPLNLVGLRQQRL